MRTPCSEHIPAVSVTPPVEGSWRWSLPPCSLRSWWPSRPAPARPPRTTATSPRRSTPSRIARWRCREPAQRGDRRLPGRATTSGRSSRRWMSPTSTCTTPTPGRGAAALDTHRSHTRATSDKGLLHRPVLASRPWPIDVGRSARVDAGRALHGRRATTRWNHRLPAAARWQLRPEHCAIWSAELRPGCDLAVDGLSRWAAPCAERPTRSPRSEARQTRSRSASPVMRVLEAGVVSLLHGDPGDFQIVESSERLSGSWSGAMTARRFQR